MIPSIEVSRLAKVSHLEREESDAPKEPTEAVQRSEGIIIADTHLPLGTQEGDNWVPEGHHATHQGSEGAPNPGGTGGEAQHVEPIPWDEPLRLDPIKQRFEVMTAARLTRNKTRASYWACFETFAECEKIARFSRRQLAGKKGRELLIAHYPHIGEPMRVFALAGIKKVWTRGLELPWPVCRDDLPAPRRSRREAAPRREFVEQWVNASRSETDPYVKSWLLVEENGGLRPIDQAAELRIEDLLFGANDDLIGIHARAADHPGFKRDADIRQSLPPEVALALRSWLAAHPSPGPGAYVWPWRHRTGRLDVGRMATEESIRRMRKAFARRHGLPWLTSKAMRHFVRTVLNSSVRDKVVRSYYQGHTPDLSDMDERYGDHETPEGTFEVQRRSLLAGVLGTFLRTEPEHDGTPAELRDIWNKVLTGDLDPLEAASALKDLARSVKQQEAVNALVKP